MIRLLIPLLLSLLASVAQAATVASVTYYGTGEYGNFSTPAAYCVNVADRKNALYPEWLYQYVIAAQTAPYQCTIKVTQRSNTNNYQHQYFTPEVRKGCADSSYVLSADGYSCSPRDESPEFCKDPNPWVVRVNYATAGPYSPPVRWGQCAVTAKTVMVCRKDPAGAGSYCLWEVKMTGQPWTGPDVATSPAPANPAGASAVDTPADTKVNTPAITPTAPGSGGGGGCPAGTVAAGTDSAGTTICMGTGTAPPPPKTAAKTTTTPPITINNADGSTTTKTTTTIQNADGSTTTRVDSSTNNGGTVTKEQTASTSKTPGGLDGKTDDPNDDNDLCKRNPMLTICKNSTVTGTCGTISCDGDAIQCATLRAAAAMQCADKADRDAASASPMNSLGTAAIAGNDPLKGSFPTPGGALAINAPSSLDASSWLGSSACFSDKSVIVQGHTITLPLSKTCDALLVLRYALMVVASLVSYRIVSNAVLT